MRSASKLLVYLANALCASQAKKPLNVSPLLGVHSALCAWSPVAVIPVVLQISLGHCLRLSRDSHMLHFDKLSTLAYTTQSHTMTLLDPQ